MYFSSSSPIRISHMQPIHTGFSRNFCRTWRRRTECTCWILRNPISIAFISLDFEILEDCRCTPLCAVGPYCCILHHIAPWCPVPLRTAEIYCCIINTVVVLLPRSAPCFAILFHTAPSSCIFVPLRAVVPYCCMLMHVAPYGFVPLRGRRFSVRF